MPLTNPQEASVFSRPSLAITDEELTALKNKNLQDAFAKVEAEGQVQADKDIQVNENKAVNDVITQAAAPEKATGQQSSDGSDEGFKKPGKDKLFDVQDLIPTILGAVIGGVAGGPGGALMGAAGGLYKGQDNRRKSDLAKLGEGNDVQKALADISYRNKQAEQGQKNFDLSHNIALKRLGIAEKTAAQGTVPSSVKEYEYYVDAQNKSGTPPDQILSYEDFSSGLTPTMKKIMEGLMTPPPQQEPQYEDLNDLLPQ